MFQGNDYLKMHTEHVLNSMKQSQELQSASMELDRVNSELRRTKIDILKNGSRKDKINLLIKEMLFELENEERVYMENLEKQTENLKLQSAFLKEAN